MAAVTAGWGSPPPHLLLAQAQLQICVTDSKTDALTENPLDAQLQFGLVKPDQPCCLQMVRWWQRELPLPHLLTALGTGAGRSGCQPEAGEPGLQEVCSLLRPWEVSFR